MKDRKIILGGVVGYLTYERVAPVQYPLFSNITFTLTTETEPLSKLWRLGSEAGPRPSTLPNPNFLKSRVRPRALHGGFGWIGQRYYSQR